MPNINKALIFDASSIITLALNDLLHILEPLKRKFGGHFFITEEVKYEVIDKPLQEKRFMLEALFIKKLYDDGVLELYKNSHLKEKTMLGNIANLTFISDGEFIRIMHSGETSCIALYNELKIEKKAVVVDERTTRVLCEAPNNLKRLLELKLHRKIHSVEKNYNYFRNINIIRSSELALMAHKYGFIDLPGKKQEVIMAILYAAKFNGCAISNQEIETLL
jgi:predicted nucleic acid-binding protein